MSKSTRPNPSFEEKAGAAAAAPALAPETTADLSGNSSSNPILFQQAVGAMPAVGAALQKASSGGSFISILSQRLPEPTSYSGKNIIALDFPDLGEIFKERPNHAPLLWFDGEGNYVDCGNPPNLQGGTSTSLTIEAWIKADNSGGDYQHIVGHGQAVKERKEVFLRIDNKKFSFGNWDGAALTVVETPVRNEDLRNWVHLAGVYDHGDKTYSLYRNGNRVATQKSEKGPLAVDGSWYIGAMYETSNNKMVRFFKGYIAEVRVWAVPRTEAEIRRYMLDSLPPTGLGQLGAYWGLADGTGSDVKDASGSENKGKIVGTPNWKLTSSPVGQLSRLLQRQAATEVQTAFTLAKQNGFFDPLVFPRVRSLMTQSERDAAMEAIKDLKFETFKAFYESGYHLILRHGFNGGTVYAFVQNPPPMVKPRLMLVEEYRLSSFLGNYGVGRTLKSFSLLPGEKTKLTIKTASTSTTTAKESKSILDSYTQESASDFESSLAEEKSNRASSSSELAYHASVEGSASWGFGSVSASAGVSGSSNSAREDFAKSVSNATSKHAAKASANRNVQVDTTTEKTSTQTQENEIVRDIENINVGRTLNFVFCQMNQEVISLLHLIDLKVGYTNGIEPMREVALFELPDLLERVIENEEKRTQVRERIEKEVRTIRNHRGDLVKDFVVEVKDAGQGKRFTVNRDFSSEFIEPATRTAATVPGIIISSQTIVMRTEDVAVDALIGQGSALDLYAEKLQGEENRRRQLANDASELQNQLLQAELKRNATLLALVEKKDIELLKACADALRVTPPGAPKRMVGVWEADVVKASTNGVSK